MVIIMSDKQQDYHAFMVETLQMFEEHNIKGLAIVALTDEETLTGYWEMDLKQRADAEIAIRYDVVDGLIMANRDKYFPMMDCTEDCEDD